MYCEVKRRTFSFQQPLWEQEVARSNRVAPTFCNSCLDTNLVSTAFVACGASFNSFVVQLYHETIGASLVPRPRKVDPKYRYHISGHAAVRLDGIDYYLGPHGSPESYAKYYSLLAEYNANGRRMPDIIETHDDCVRIKHLIAEYRTRELPRSEHNPGDHGWQSNLLELIDTKFGELEIDEFGPRKLEVIRDVLVGRDNCRSYINKQIRFVIRVFKHGVGRELVDPATVDALECLRPLRRGEAREGRTETPADIEAVRATMERCCDCVRAMIQVQLGTGMRPTELFSMRVGDIDRRGDVFMYRPPEHKTSGHGITKAVPLVGDTLEAITPYLIGDSDQLVFRTDLGTAWTKDAYRRHIDRARVRAGAEHWTPKQLRHNAATAVAESGGLDKAKSLLGHSTTKMTERYVHQMADEAAAIEAAKILANNC